MEKRETEREFEGGRREEIIEEGLKGLEISSFSLVKELPKFF